jgi:hypothetical protein
VACLVLPHPRLKERWRVTQEFDTRVDAMPGAERAVIEFSRIGDPSATVEDGRPCRPEK